MSMNSSVSEVVPEISRPTGTNMVIISLSIISLFSLLLARHLLARSRKLKGPRRWPFVGSYFQVVKNFPVLHDWFLSFFSKDCKTVGVDWGLFYTILTVDPANVEYILKTNFANYPKGSTTHVRNYELMGDGIFNSDGDNWKRHRKLASYEFSSRKVNEFSASVYKKYGVKLMEVLGTLADSDTTFDFQVWGFIWFSENKQQNLYALQDVCMRMTLDSICELAFGVQLSTLSPSLPEVPFATSFDRSNELIVRRSIGPIWKLLRALNLGSERELRKHIQVLDSFTFKVIQNRRNEMKASSKQDEKQDLLSRFMTSSPGADDQTEYKDKELRDAILNFIIAGRDTTAITLSWFVFCVCKNPRVVENIRKEMDEVFGAEKLPYSEFAELLTTENLRKLHYLHASLSETLRLYPPVPRDGKCAANDDVLPDGTEVKRGDTVAYVPYSMGRMEFLWGEDALEYKPERWIQNSEYHPESPFKYSTFQAGPRICLGKDTAYLQIKITSALLIRYFHLELSTNHIVHYRLLMVLAMVNGIKVQASRV